MRTIKLVFSSLLLSFIVITASARSSGPDSRDKVLQEFTVMTEAWQRAYNSGDAMNLMPYYSEDARYISSHVTGLELTGRDKVLDNFQEGINHGGHIDSLEILQMNFSGDMASLLCKYQATNSGIRVTGRNLLVLKKTGSNWRIIIHMTVV